MKDHTTSQKDEILNYLLLGPKLTPLEALQYFGTMKLSTRCSELRKEGWPIMSQYVKTTTEKYVKEYWIQNKKSE